MGVDSGKKVCYNLSVVYTKASTHKIGVDDYEMSFLR